MNVAKQLGPERWALDETVVVLPHDSFHRSDPRPVVDTRRDARAFVILMSLRCLTLYKCDYF